MGVVGSGVGVVRFHVKGEGAVTVVLYLRDCSDGGIYVQDIPSAGVEEQRFLDSISAHTVLHFHPGQSSLLDSCLRMCMLP